MPQALLTFRKHMHQITTLTETPNWVAANYVVQKLWIPQSKTNGWIRVHDVLLSISPDAIDRGFETVKSTPQGEYANTTDGRGTPKDG